MATRKFRWSTDNGANWTEDEQALPFNLASVTIGDTVLVEPIGAAVENEGVVVPANNIVAALGDSRTHPTSMPDVDSSLWWAQVRRMLNGQADLRFSKIFGTGGITTSTIVSTYLASAAASGAGSILLLCGVNDSIAGDTLATTLSNIDTIISTLRANDIVVFIADEYPFGSAYGATGAQLANQAAIRDYIRTLDDPANGINVLPTWDAIASTPDGDTAVALNLKSDGLHEIDLGAYAMGKAAATVMAPYFAGFDNVIGDAANIYSGFTGGGLNTAPQVNSANVAFTLHSGAGITYDMVDEGSVRWLKVTFPDYALADTTAMAIIDMPNIALATLGLTAGTDYVEYAIRYRAELTGFRGIDQQLLYSGGTAVPNLHDAVGPGSADTVNLMTSEYHEGVLRLPRFQLPGGANRCLPRLYLAGSNGKTVSGTLWLSQPTLLKFASAA